MYFRILFCVDIFIILLHSRFMKIYFLNFLGNIRRTQIFLLASIGAILRLNTGGHCTFLVGDKCGIPKFSNGRPVEFNN